MGIVGDAGRITANIVDHIATVTIDNPRQRNALTREMCIQLRELMPLLEADPDVTVITLRGAGATFSAGANIAGLTSVLLDPQPDGTVIDQLSLADSAIDAVSKPTIALVDGSCMGGGWQLASACDFIIASERSVFAITPAKLGVIYPRAGLERLVRQVGRARAKYMMFTGETYSARRAAALGLVAEIVQDGEFDARCSAIVTAISFNSRFSVHTLKSLVGLPASETPEVAEAWNNAWLAMAASPDLEIGVAAFQARERPHFRWRPDAAPASRSRP